MDFARRYNCEKIERVIDMRHIPIGTYNMLASKVATHSNASRVSSVTF